MAIPKKQNWFDLAVEISNFHAKQLKEDPRWTIAKTAIALNRSIGSISQNITIAQWSLSHEKHLKRCHNAREALEFINEMKRDMKVREI